MLKDVALQDATAEFQQCSLLNIHDGGRGANDVGGTRREGKGLGDVLGWQR